MYKIFWTEIAIKGLNRLSPEIAVRIKHKVEDYLSTDPISLGKPLTGIYKGLYRYRFGDYRIVYEVQKEKVIVIITQIGHRSNVY